MLSPLESFPVSAAQWPHCAIRCYGCWCFTCHSPYTSLAWEGFVCFPPVYHVCISMDVVIKKDRVAPMLVVRLAARYICSLDGHGVEYHPVSHSPFHIYWLFPCLVFQQDAVCCNSCCISDRFNLSVTNRQFVSKHWTKTGFQIDFFYWYRSVYYGHATHQRLSVFPGVQRQRARNLPNPTFLSHDCL